MQDSNRATSLPLLAIDAVSALDSAGYSSPLLYSPSSPAKKPADDDTSTVVTSPDTLILPSKYVEPARRLADSFL